MRAFLLAIPVVLLLAGLAVSNALGLSDVAEVAVVSIGALAGGALALVLIAR